MELEKIHDPCALLHCRPEHRMPRLSLVSIHPLEHRQRSLPRSPSYSLPSRHHFHLLVLEIEIRFQFHSRRPNHYHSSANLPLLRSIPLIQSARSAGHRQQILPLQSTERPPAHLLESSPGNFPINHPSDFDKNKNPEKVTEEKKNVENPKQGNPL